MTKSSHWIVSPIYDFFFFFFGIVILLLVLVTEYINFSGALKPLQTYNGSAMHLHTMLPIATLTLFALYFKNQNLNNSFKAVIAILLIIPSVIIFSMYIYDFSSQASMWILNTVGCIYVNWNIYHFSKQNFGFFIIYLKKKNLTISSKFRNFSNYFFILNSGVITSIIFINSFNMSYNPNNLIFNFLAITISNTFLLFLSAILTLIFLICIFKNYKLSTPIVLSVLFNLLQNGLFVYAIKGQFGKLIFYAYPHIVAEIGLHIQVFKNSNFNLLPNVKYPIIKLILTVLVFLLTAILIFKNKSVYRLVTDGMMSQAEIEKNRKNVSFILSMSFFYFHTMSHYISDRALFKLSKEMSFLGIKERVLGLDKRL